MFPEMYMTTAKIAKITAKEIIEKKHPILWMTQERNPN
jgi:hypothetical protein